MKRLLVVALLLMPACAGQEPVASVPTQIPNTNTPAIQTNADLIRQALSDNGYHALATVPDRYLNRAGADICDIAETTTSLSGEPLIGQIGHGFVEGLEEGFTTTEDYTSHDGAVMVELFIKVYCPELV